MRVLKRVLLIVVLLTVAGVACERASTPTTAPGELVMQLGHSRQVSALSFSKDGKFLATGGYDQRLCVWEVATGQLVREWPAACAAPSIDSVGWLDDREVETMACREFRSWAIDSGQFQIASKPRLRPVPNSHLFAVSPDGKTKAIAGGWEGTIQFVNTSDEKVLRTLNAYARMGGGHLSADCRTLATFGAAGVQVWDLDAAKLKAEFPFQVGVIELWSTALSPDGNTVAMGMGDNNGRTGMITVYSVADQKVRFELWGLAFTEEAKAAFGPVSAIKFTADGKTIGTTHFDVDHPDKVIEKFWDLAGHSVDAPVKGVKWSESPGDGAFHIGQSGDGSVALYDKANQLRAKLTVVAVQKRNLEHRWNKMVRGPIDWLWTTPDGHYAGSPGAEKLVTWRVNGQIKPADAAPAMRSLDAVRAALRVE